MLSTTLSVTEIDSALHSNLDALKEAFFDLLAALVLFLIAICSIVHAVLRMVFAGLGLLLWSLALLIVFLYWLRAWAVGRSSSSVHTER
jgi:hypothetical protein